MSGSGDRAEEMVDEEVLLMAEVPLTKDQIIALMDTEFRRLLSEQVPSIVRSVLETRDLVLNDNAAEGVEEDYEDVAPPVSSSFSSHSSYVAQYPLPPAQPQNHVVHNYTAPNPMATAQQPMAGVPMAGPQMSMGMVPPQNQWGHMNAGLPAKRKKIVLGLYCFFCKNRGHKAMECATVISRAVRRTILMNTNRCVKCTKLFKDHDPFACAALKCGQCGLRTHPSALCPQDHRLTD